MVGLDLAMKVFLINLSSFPSNLTQGLSCRVGEALLKQPELYLSERIAVVQRPTALPSESVPLKRNACNSEDEIHVSAKEFPIQ